MLHFILEMRTTTFLISLVAVALATPRCGRTPVSPHLKTTMPHYMGNLIVGGDVAIPYSWPWQVAICITDWFESYEFACEGSMIDQYYVMTTANCVYNGRNPKSYRVTAGVFDVTNSEEEDEQFVKVKAIHKHPLFDPVTFVHDIALVELADPLELTDHVQPVCVPNGDTNVTKPPTAAFFTGWGSTDDGGSMVKYLRQVKVPFVDIEVCASEYPKLIQEDNMICVGQKGLGPCHGDDGGPLVVQADDGRWFQYGIFSWSYGCAVDKYPSVYSRVTSFCSFIAETTNNYVTCQ